MLSIDFANFVFVYSTRVVVIPVVPTRLLASYNLHKDKEEEGKD